MFQVSLLTDNGNTKDDLKLPTDETLLGQVCMNHVIYADLRCLLDF